MPPPTVSFQNPTRQPHEILPSQLFQNKYQVDFADGDSVKNAFLGDGKSLGRRKVGVQEYVDLRILLAGAPPEAADIPIGGPFKVAVSGFDPLCDEDEIYSGLKKMISEQSEEEVEFKDQTITLFPEHSCVLEFNTLAGCISTFFLFIFTSQIVFHIDIDIDNFIFYIFDNLYICISK